MYKGFRRRLRSSSRGACCRTKCGPTFDETEKLLQGRRQAERGGGGLNDPRPKAPVIIVKKKRTRRQATTAARGRSRTPTSSPR